MQEPPNVLPITRFMLRWGIRLNFVGIAFLVLLAFSLVTYSDEVARHFLEYPGVNVSGVSVEMSPSRATVAAGILIATSLVSLVLLMMILRTLVKVVDSVRTGDPFIPENGPRLRRIAWLLLYTQLTAIGAGLTLSIMFGVIKVSVNTLFGPVLAGALTALLAFILARVFEAGSAMRSEIRETI